MDPNEALEELQRVSADVRAAVVFERGGAVRAATTTNDVADEIAELGDAMLAYAETLRDGVAVQRVQAATRDGSVFVARDGDRAVAAVAHAGAVAGLVEHDLRALLARVPKTRRRAKADAVA
jgi:predicted regulator of Ras-like GTPase activity (Roadblock/LC7/MglB family)